MKALKIPPRVPFWPQPLATFKPQGLGLRCSCPEGGQDGPIPGPQHPLSQLTSCPSPGRVEQGEATGALGCLAGFIIFQSAQPNHKC